MILRSPGDISVIALNEFLNSFILKIHYSANKRSKQHEEGGKQLSLQKV